MMFSQRCLAVLLLPIGMALVVMGFWLENPGARTSLQVFGLIALGAGVWLGQRLLNPLTRDAHLS
jgi:hypothetical protein